MDGPCPVCHKAPLDCSCTRLAQATAELQRRFNQGPELEKARAFNQAAIELRTSDPVRGPCACGVLHTMHDPTIETVARFCLQWWPPGVFRKDRRSAMAVVRACRQCRQLYALTAAEDEKLPGEVPP
jgi:hypothetical protein